MATLSVPPQYVLIITDEILRRENLCVILVKLPQASPIGFPCFPHSSSIYPLPPSGPLPIVQVMPMAVYSQSHAPPPAPRVRGCYRCYPSGLRRTATIPMRLGPHGSIHQEGRSRCYGTDNRHIWPAFYHARRSVYGEERTKGGEFRLTDA